MYDCVADDLSLRFHLEHRRRELNTLGIRWKKAMDNLPSLGTEPSWPSFDLTRWELAVADDDLEHEQDVRVGGAEDWSDGEDIICPPHSEPTDSEAIEMIDIIDGGQGFGVGIRVSQRVHTVDSDDSLTDTDQSEYSDEDLAC
jgi:hypothetical protein